MNSRQRSETSDCFQLASHVHTPRHMQIGYGDQRCKWKQYPHCVRHGAVPEYANWISVSLANGDNYKSAALARTNFLREYLFYAGFSPAQRVVRPSGRCFLHISLQAICMLIGGETVTQHFSQRRPCNAGRGWVRLYEPLNIESLQSF